MCGDFLACTARKNKKFGSGLDAVGTLFLVCPPIAGNVAWGFRGKY